MSNDTNTTVHENSFMLMVGGAVPSPTYQYAPADFLDAEDTRPPELLLDPTGYGSTTPYTTVTMNSLSKHLHEVKEAQRDPGMLQKNWKQKLREFLLILVVKWSVIGSGNTNPSFTNISVNTQVFY